MFDGIDAQDIEYAEFDDSAPQRYSNAQSGRGNGRRRHNNRHWHEHNTYTSAKQMTSIQTSITMPAIMEEISEEYLYTSLQLSHRTAQPTRKLLVLDLNGTLLYRLPAPPRSRFRHKFHVYSDASPAPSRVALPRPYLPSFRRYLFHPATRVWLDVMVWSSAQPHSVRNMLQFCFPKEEEQLTKEAETEANSVNAADNRFFAVWARDTLGLSRADYSRKVQTTKNLEKIWSKSSGTHSPESEDSPYSSIHTHSSFSTILVDDSPLKARLQPWNHLCIREYGEADSKQDTRIIQALHVKRKNTVSVVTDNDNGTEVTKVEQVSSAEGVTGVLNRSEVSGLGEDFTTRLDIETVESQEIQVSEQFERLPNQTRAAHISYESYDSLSSIDQGHTSTLLNASETPSTIKSPPASSETTPPPSSVLPPGFKLEPSPHFDETLLAIIGVLEVLKNQSNVSGWLRNRGLWIKSDEENAVDGESATPEVGSLADDTSSQTPIHSLPEPTSESVHFSSAYLNVRPLSPERGQIMSIPGLSFLEDSTSQVVSGTTLKRNFQELSDIESERKGIKRAKSSNGVVSITSSSSSPSVAQPQHEPTHTHALADSETGTSFLSPIAPSWFEDKDIFAYWVKQGRRALQELDIAELHGLEMPDSSQ